MTTTQRSGYTVFEWADAATSMHLPQLLSVYPKLVEGLYVAITSFDSGFFEPSNAEIDAGWQAQGQIAYSPLVADWRELPYEVYDEWFVFQEPTTVCAGEPMVNYLGFSPIGFDWPEKLDLFWTRIIRHRPIHVIGDGQHLFLITRDERTIRNIAEQAVAE